MPRRPRARRRRHPSPHHRATHVPGTLDTRRKRRKQRARKSQREWRTASARVSPLRVPASENAVSKARSNVPARLERGCTIGRMRARSRLAVCLGAALACTCSAACAGLLGDFSDSPSQDASVDATVAPDASIDAGSSPDASLIPPRTPKPARPMRRSRRTRATRTAPTPRTPATRQTRRSCGAKCAVALGASGTSHLRGRMA